MSEARQERALRLARMVVVRQQEALRDVLMVIDGALQGAEPPMLRATRRSLWQRISSLFRA